MSGVRFRSLPARVVLVFVCAACCPSAILAAEGDWPMWRCDAGRTGASSLELPAPLHLEWKRLLPLPRPAFSNDPRVRFDLSYEPVAGGKPLWQRTVATPADQTARQAQPSFSPFLPPQLAFGETSDVLVYTRNRSTAAAYQGTTGRLLWAREVPCKGPPDSFTGYHPPIVLSDVLVSHGGEMIDLGTGKAVAKPLWKGANADLRGCGRALGSPCMITVRDGHASYFDLTTGGHVYFRGIRSGCTNSLIPADGILSAPNFARGCTCNYPLSVSFALVTMPEVAAWRPARAENR